jgi:cytochrome c-type biogenesis protein CcmH
VKKILTLLVMLCAVWCVQSKEAVPLAEDPAIEQRMIAISEEMRCLVCQNESLAGSRAELAQDLRNELRQLLKDGKSDEEIKAFMVDRYGDFVLYRPPVKSSTWLLWIGPYVLLFLAIVFLIWQLKELQDEEGSADLSEDERQKVKKLLNDSAVQKGTE